ncbi:DUF1853 family protein [Marinomonas transparens]|uniref:DUF1853 family protein n=1 Tax=Marinomonas transparens TaxID=2795388 RepID=A0A934MX20_9GAMM|nr:DUF1853 family protein [Marinomonas transparens]MBJ7538824.1 DUF1853 family protein [Marinomonas transparens]
MISGQIKHPFVKDLAWLVEGHYIERDFDLTPYWLPDVEARLLELADSPTLLEGKVVACKSHFLGSYFEALFSFAIEHLSSLKIVDEHFQIEANGKTLGEVDMLVETLEGELHQFEIAIKFYLQRPDLHPHDWIGPNKNDSLLKKVTRAREHQLSILQTKEGRLVVEKVAKGRAIQSSLLIFGRLYMALDSSQSVANWLQQSKFGAWVYVSDLVHLIPSFTHYSVLQKPHWLASPNLTHNTPFFSSEYPYNLVSEFLLDSRPKHLCLWRDHACFELSDFSVFVVPDLW